MTYRYRPYQSPRTAAKTKTRRTMAVQSAIIGGTVGFSMMVMAVAVTLTSAR